MQFLFKVAVVKCYTISRILFKKYNEILLNHRVVLEYDDIITK